MSNNEFELGVACFDAGGTTFRAALFSEDAKIVSEVIEQPSPSGKEAEVIYETFNDMVRKVRQVAEANRYSVQVISIGIAGPADYEEGVVKHMPGQQKFGSLYNQNLKEAVQARTGIRTVLGNDANLYALGVGKEFNKGRVGVVTLGTGLGGGFLKNGELLESGIGVPQGGEIWDLPYKDKPWLEEYISRRAIRATFSELTGLQDLDVKEIADLAKEAAFGKRSDDVALAALKTFNILAQEIGEGLYMAFGEFRPQVIVFGGKISKSFDLFGKRAEDVFNKKADFSVVFSQASNPDFALIGAARHAIRS